MAGPDSALARPPPAEAAEAGGSLLAVSDLKRIDYFTSFPHLVNVPVTVARDEESLRAFRSGNGSAGQGPLQLDKLAPAEAVLAPAACYSVYPSLRGAPLDAPLSVTVCGTCFRAEDRYQPLRRQRCFRMREVVHVGTPESAKAFLEVARKHALALAARLDLPLELATATDPFFDPSKSSKYLHQKLFPTKHEMVFGGGLAIGSLNYHRHFFGEAFGLKIGGAPAHTACLAFGVERWIHAIAERHGSDPRGWPVIEGSAHAGAAAND